MSGVNIPAYFFRLQARRRRETLNYLCRAEERKTSFASHKRVRQLLHSPAKNGRLRRMICRAITVAATV